MMIITEKRHELILEELSHKDFLTLQELIDRTDAVLQQYEEIYLNCNN